MDQAYIRSIDVYLKTEAESAPVTSWFLRRILGDEESKKKKKDCGSECNFQMGNPNKFNNKEKIYIVRYVYN